ncbi:LysR family transcriptional regulator [Herbaspirillum frisingense]|uniref:LysR family transcriptional regulator n=2 Tax=Herbaspirillum TaxID=963 RepID=UPI002DD44266|nr:LysR family transcriptional regulator [Herbaspirillum frisingense]
MGKGKSSLLKVKGAGMGFDGRLLSGMTVLAAVVETGSFTRAAEVLGLSASGVSRAVTRLEERIGIRLLDRSTRALHLTDDGGRLYQLAAPHLSGIEEAANAVSRSATSARGILRVGLNPLFSGHVLAPRIAEFTERYPEIELVSVAFPDNADLVSEGIDVAVRFGPQPSSAMTSLKLMETRVLTVAAPGYLNKHGTPRHPDELVKHDCMQFIDPRRGRPFNWEFHRGKEVRQIQTRGRLTLTDPNTMVGACIAGAGIAQVLALGMAPLLESGALLELFPDWPGETFPLYLIRPSRRLPPAAVQAFIDFCVEISRPGRKRPGH